jgi:predicted enzyme related to lactoylglutathione lyase
MLKLKSLFLFSEKPDELAKFYKKVFAKEPDFSDGGYSGFTLGEGMIIIGPHDKVKGENKNPERIFANFESDDVKGEFEKIKKIGAKVIAAPYHPDEEKKMTLATFADPDGNYFQLASPME